MIEQIQSRRGDMQICKEIRDIQQLINLRQLELAETKSLALIKAFPECINAWDTLISVQMATPLEDYETAISYLRKGYQLFPSQHIYFALAMYLKETFCGGINELDRLEITEKIKIIDPKARAVLYLALAKHSQGVDNRLYINHLINSIKSYPDFSSPYISLGEFYLRRGKQEKAKAYIKLGIEKVKEVFSEKDCSESDSLISTFIDEEIGGTSMQKKAYLRLKKLSS